MVSVAEYYSSEMVAFVRRVLEIVPVTVFSILKQIIQLQTKMNVRCGGAAGAAAVVCQSSLTHKEGGGGGMCARVCVAHVVFHGVWTCVLCVATYSPFL